MASGQERTCQSCKGNFAIEPEDISFYGRFQVPPPTFCPQCRLVRRLAFRNERNFYKHPCDMCRKDTISIFAPDKPYRVYCPPDWSSDKWDPLEYGRAYDFSKPFFVQFMELLRDVPMPSLNVIYSTLTNSDYVNLCAFSKNCYLTSHADHNENCSYASGLKFSNDCVDVTMVQNSQLCYECLNVFRGYRNAWCVDCEDCSDMYFSKNCVGCSDCIGCVNLRGKKYCIFNMQYSKEEYLAKREELQLGSYKGLMRAKEQAERLWAAHPNKCFRGSHNQSVSGDYLYESKNTRSSYEMVGVEDSKHCQFLSTKPSRDCMDYTEWGDGSALVYETLTSGVGLNMVRFCYNVESNSRNIEYSMLLSGCQDMFGCVSMRSKQYCILNRQYSKEEYKSLAPKIIAHMNDMPYVDANGRTYRYGEFFPAELSMFAYNESTAQEFFPLGEQQALAKGYRWKKEEPRDYRVTAAPDTLPDTIGQTPTSMVNEVIGCAHAPRGTPQCAQSSCTTAFRITPDELEFYKKMNLPLPRLCPNCRHYERAAFRNPMKFWQRTCQCAGGVSADGRYHNTVHHFHSTSACPNEFETCFDPEKQDIVYCESCYNAEVA